MASVDFEWDDAKDLSNQQEHGLSFSEAQRLFESGADCLEISTQSIPNSKTASSPSAQSIAGSWLSSTQNEKKTSSESLAPG